MTNRAWAWLLASTLAAAVGACGDARQGIAQGEYAIETCTRCHGGTDGEGGAPPRDTRGRTATSELTVGAHTAHVKAGPLAAAIDCDACHVKPIGSSSPGHLDGGARMIVWGGVATAKGATPAWDRASATCSNVYCHGATLSGGSNVSPRWTAVDGTQAACGACHGLPPPNHPELVPGFTRATCSACHPETLKPDGSVDVAGGRHVNGQAEGFAGHPAGWLDVSSPAFHGPAALANPSACLTCHAATPPAEVTPVTCSKCHDRAGSGDWSVRCTSCHGSTNAAPPRDLSGNTASSFVGVGAHQSHVLGTHGFSAPLDCTSCHARPGAVTSAGHMDGMVQVTGYTGSDPALSAAIQSPGWDRASATCSASYCHGAGPGMGGGAVGSPIWTRVDGSQAFCGSCHGLPPTAHPGLPAGADARSCAPCHPGTVKPDGTIDVASGRHINGIFDGFPGHPADWMTNGSAGFHGRAVTQGASICFQCHAARPPATVSRVTCADCHDALAGGDWTTSCRGCHGSASNPAPPEDIPGNLATTARGVGAHQSHVTGAHGLAAPLDCVFCHQKPADPFSPGHMDGAVQLTGYTGSDAAMAASLPSQGWDETAATCTNYCHGAASQGGANIHPRWTKVDGSQAICGSCHGLPPANHPALAIGTPVATCALCHPSTVKADGTVDAPGGKHVNGRVEMEGFTGHGAGWLVPGGPGSHGQAAVTQGTSSCFRCHSAKEPSTNGIRSCASCHDALAGGADWTTSCIGCHGSAASSAPPRDVHGNTATTAIGVGAHRSHVEAPSGIAQRYDCSVCHEKPGVVFSPGHLDGATTVTGYTGADTGLQFVKEPGWDRTTATCATSWCHGNYSGTFTYYTDDGSGTLVQVDFPYAGSRGTPRWNQVDGTQATCGTCHGRPPSGGIWHGGSHGGTSNYNGCDICHQGTTPDGSGFADSSRHVNGVVDVDPGWRGDCFDCH